MVKKRKRKKRRTLDETNRNQTGKLKPDHINN